MHVHFHLIPRFDDRGLGIGWNAGSLVPDEARELVAKMQVALEG
jgi:diadenosine tetraphosphate (Ap4A) HIT family hydrolase